MSELELSALLGVFVPLVVGYFTNTSTSPKVKGLAALFLSIGIGIAMAYVKGDLRELPTDPAGAAAGAVQYILVIAVSAQTAYSMFIKPTGLSEYLQLNWGNVGHLNESPNDPITVVPNEVPEVADESVGFIE